MTTESTNQPEYLAMSDADVMAMGAPEMPAALAAEATTEVAVDTSAVSEEGVAAEGTETDEVATDTVADESGEGAAQDVVIAVAAKEAPTVDTPADTKPEDKPADVVAVDFEAEYKRLLTPFKANGHEITINSVDDAVALMQMGANYNKKMAALKPNLKLMKLLENNSLLSEEKISFLIELDKKSPEAINKLVKDSGINPMDFDAEKAGEYEPKIHKVDDREMALDTVLDDISSTPTYTRTLEIVSKQWDGASKQVIAEAPQLLKLINDQVDSGIYDLISTEVQRERVFGRLSGLSDIEAYRQVGDAIQARGGFNHLGKAQAKTNTPPVVVAPKPKKVEDDKLNDKRRAASSTKPAALASKALPEGFNPLALSDEDFAKFDTGRFR